MTRAGNGDPEMYERFRALARCAVRMSLFAAVVAGVPRFAGADTSGPATDATTIVDACSSAETQLKTVHDLVTKIGPAYRAALYKGEAYVAQAYRLSLLTPWPDDLASTRRRLDSSLLITIGKLARMDRPSPSWTVADVRSIFDREITRVHRAVVMLQGVTLPPPAVPAPAPAPVQVPPPPPAPVTSTTTIPVLAPGSGFAAATQQPATVGSGKFADAKAIARWDVVPYQTFTSKFTVGVIAFHASGIDRVEFSLNGGAWTAVTAMSRNPITNVWEYNAAIDPTTVADGQVEVRAVAYPNVGIPRVLAGPHDSGDAAYTHGEYSLFLSANGGGTLPSLVRYVSGATGSDTSGDGTEANPFATITQAAISIRDTPAPYTPGAGNGAVIYLDAYLSYAFADTGYGPTNDTRWITVAGKPGLTPDQVRITSCNPVGHGLNVKNVRLSNLTLYGDMQIIPGSPEISPRVWADGCVLDGGSKSVYPVYFDPSGQWRGGIFVTNCTMKNLGRAAYGYQLARDLVIHDVGEDAIRNSGGLVVDCSVQDLVPVVQGVHPDLVQWDAAPGSQIENMVVYGLKADDIISQGLFIRLNAGSPTPENLAFVNCDMHVQGSTQFLHDIHHMLIWNCNFLTSGGSGGSFIMSDDVDQTTTIHNLSLRNTVIQYFSAHCTTEPLVTDPSWADNNHFIDMTTYGAMSPGTNVTTGSSVDSLFRAFPTDTTPAAGSVLVNRVTTLLVPADAAGVARSVPDAIGAFGAAH
jgi:hypothetical protein